MNKRLSCYLADAVVCIWHVKRVLEISVNTLAPPLFVRTEIYVSLLWKISRYYFSLATTCNTMLILNNTINLICNKTRRF